MSRLNTVESIALATVVLAGGACSKGVEVAGPKMAPTSRATPAPSVELGGTLFEQASCNKGEITFPKPLGWSVLEVSVTPNLINCYASEGFLTREENFRKGLRISRLVEPSSWSDQDRIGHAKQLASQPDGRGLFPIANTFKQTREGAFMIFSGKFTGNRNNVYVEEERKIFAPDGSKVIYIVTFTAPKPTADDDFRKYGRQMMDKLQIKHPSNL